MVKTATAITPAKIPIASSIWKIPINISNFLYFRLGVAWSSASKVFNFLLIFLQNSFSLFCTINNAHNCHFESSESIYYTKFKCCNKSCHEENTNKNQSHNFCNSPTSEPPVMIEDKNQYSRPSEAAMKSNEIIIEKILAPTPPLSYLRISL